MAVVMLVVVLIGPFDAPCRTRNIQREIPSVAWYNTAIAQYFLGGFLPFSAVSVELYYIFATVWGRDNYTLYGILLIVFMVLIVGMCHYLVNTAGYSFFVGFVPSFCASIHESGVIM